MRLLVAFPFVLFLSDAVLQKKQLKKKKEQNIHQQKMIAEYVRGGRTTHLESPKGSIRLIVFGRSFFAALLAPEAAAGCFPSETALLELLNKLPNPNLSIDMPFLDRLDFPEVTEGGTPVEATEDAVDGR